ncbi:MAG: hypothetical protein IT340_01985 [Chloroflexi bacterium]|nr:hypothetical protein [Chloroflexota bacterium]
MDTTMKPLRHIPSEELARDLTGILDHVIQTREPIVVEGQRGAVVIRPTPRLAPRQRRQRLTFVADDAIAPATTYTPTELAASAPTLPARRDWRQVVRAVKVEKVAHTRRKLQTSRDLSTPMSLSVP